MINSHVFSLALWLVIKKIYAHKEGNKRLQVAKIRALCSYLTPNLFLFYFLYYTEVTSLFFLALAYYLVLCKDRVTAAAYTGFLSLMVRQNNIVWLNLIVFLDIIQLFEDKEKCSKLADFPKLVKFIIQCFPLLFWRYIEFIAIDVVFIIFFIANDYSVVLGDKDAHQLTLNPC